MTAPHVMLIPDWSAPAEDYSPAALRERRDALGLTRTVLARLIGTTPAVIGNFEKRRTQTSFKPPSARMLGKLAWALGCDVTDFFEPVDEAPAEGGQDA